MRGSWTDATVVEIVTADGKTVAARAQPAAGQVAGVDEEYAATGLWWFPSATLQSVAAGDYRVRARLQMSAGSGAKDDVLSDQAKLRVVPESDDPARATQRGIARAQAAIVAGALAKAADLLNAMLEKDPDNVPALSLHAALSLHGGNRTVARVCVDRALRVSFKTGTEPSTALHELAAQIDRALAEPAITGEVPDWTRVPHAVFEPVQRQQAAATAVPAQGTPALTSVASTAKARPVASGPVPTTVPAVPPESAAASPVHDQAGTSPGVVLPAASLNDASVGKDSTGQWAESATASSQYDKKHYSAAQATGAPNVSVAGNSPDAWSPAKKNDGTEWLQLTFAKPSHATEVRIRQNDTPGCIAKVEAIEPDGTVHLWWEGADPYVVPAVREIVWFAVLVPKPSYLVAKIKITLNLSAVAGWKEIDAVQLVGTD